MNIELDWMKRWALYSPTKIALRCADSNRSFSFKELYERSNYLAQILRDEHGIKNGDRVAVLSMNEPEYLFLFFALQRLGAILVPVNYRFTAREVDHVLKDSGAKLFLYQAAYAHIAEKLAPVVEEILPFERLIPYLFDLEPTTMMEMDSSFESPVMILYTSGTTGAPKGAVITNKMLFWNSVNTGLRLNITPSDKTLIFHPFFHTSGWNVLTTPFLHHGASIVMLKKFDSDRVLKICEEEKLTILFGVPTMMDMMARTRNFHRTDFFSLRYAVVGGEPMPLELIQAWAKKSVPVRQGYGLTEFGPNVFSLNEEDSLRKMGSIGFPNFYVEVKILSADGKEITEPNMIGELCLRGPAMMAGYWGNEKASQECIKDGWLHTGDLVQKDVDGYFYIKGRKKEMFISGAENVYPAEVEQVIRAIPGVHEAAVIGVKDPKWGEVGKCFYSTVDSRALDEAHLREFCEKNLAKYKIPKFFHHQAELPKGDSGKILKKNLQ